LIYLASEPFFFQKKYINPFNTKHLLHNCNISLISFNLFFFRIPDILELRNLEYHKYPPMKKQLSVFIKLIFYKSSWVIFFALLCLMIYEHESISFDKEYNKLKNKQITLEVEKLAAIELNTELKSRINSQSDPAWLEIILIKGLGLVPEGQKKIIFKKDTQP